MLKTKTYKSFIFCVLFFLALTQVHAQSSDPPITDMDDIFTDYVKDITAAAALTGSIGLAWSKQYIGPFIQRPSHWGIGISVGTVTLKMNNIEKMAAAILGVDLSRSFADKQILPSYVAEMRVGGNSRRRLDFGIKGGFLPVVPILFKNGLDYNFLHYGFDVRYGLLHEYKHTPDLGIGIEVDRVKGGLTNDSQGEIEYIRGAETSSLTYDTWSINAKAGVSKTFFYPSITIFANLKIGISLSKSGYKFDGSSLQILENDGAGGTVFNNIHQKSKSQLEKSGEYLSDIFGTGKFTVTPESISCILDKNVFNLNTTEGVSFNFYNGCVLQFTFMFDFTHLEYGGSISFRYQR
ncbi:MAG: hypothetical protein Ta2F_14440 [Termitinemataceae bacterium]|nr:MAG: hypothetical protein Ta2F_14440 [Termitinemataceae bacterium]